ncbi:MAG TPA: outer membrane protein assembly factor BamD [Rubricoccaceae bacterium]|nr:outer membrane protein assembly factor BamD [Rubricoccaceae bacterium]
MRPFVRLLCLLVLVGGAACGPSTPLTAAGPEEAYQRGMLAYEARRWDRAIEHFRAALDFGRTNEWADDAQFYLARAYYEDEQYLLSGTEYTRFIELYPNDPRVEEAAFERIRSYAALSPPYQLDQTDTETAIAYIRAFMTRYPTSTRTADLVAVLEELQEKLARKQYETGRLYERRELFEAAALSFEAVLEQFPTSPYADDALVGAIRAYIRFAEASIRERQAERYQRALDTYDRLVQLFPQSPLLPEAEALYARAHAGLRAVQPAASPVATDGRDGG